MQRIIADRFNDSQAFCSPFAEQYSVTHSKILWPLHKAECNYCTITGSDKSSVDVDDSACLRYGTDVQHGLIFGFDGSGVAED